MLCPTAHSTLHRAAAGYVHRNSAKTPQVTVCDDRLGMLASGSLLQTADCVAQPRQRAAYTEFLHQRARQDSTRKQSCHIRSGSCLTLPLGCEAQVLAPGSQAGQHLMLRRAALRVQLPRQHLNAQQLTQLGVVPAGVQLPCQHLSAQQLAQLKVVSAGAGVMMLLSSVVGDCIGRSSCASGFKVAEPWMAPAVTGKMWCCLVWQIAWQHAQHIAICAAHHKL